jgi:RNA polymerase sigma factor (sigma-70 family)
LATLASPGVSATARSRPDVTDHDLVQAVRAGDDHAFERLYHRYHRRISAYIFGMVHDHGRAEDLTQEVFVSALRRMRQTDRPIAFKPWVYEIAKNACIDQFRRTSRTEEVSIDAEDGALAPGDQGKLHARGQTPDAAVESKQQLADLQGAFGELSDAHHQILVMRELEGLSYREIGERLGMSRPSVESTLFRARRRVRGAAHRRAVPADRVDHRGRERRVAGHP